jgi:ribose transport system ATP-binding protein
MTSDRATPDPTPPAASEPPEVPSLQARALSKSFGPQRALDGVDLTINAGEVVALLGENGSGKSTLVKILAGYHEPEPGGELSMAGQAVPLPVALGGSRDIGLAFVYQDLGLANELTVVENLFVGHRVSGRGRSGEGRPSRGPIHWRSERRAARAAFDRYGVDLDPGAVVGELRPTGQALLAIVRAAEELREYRQGAGSGRGGVLVLDEPTVFLPEHEKVFLFDLVRRVVADGTGVLFVSHDMTAVREICHRAVVLRDGRMVGDVKMADTDDAQLVGLVSGHRLGVEGLQRLSTAGVGHRAAEPARDGGVAPAGDAALSVQDVSGGRLRGIELSVRAGEILGVAGLLGSGSEDLPYALFGALPRCRGTMRLSGWSGEIADLSPGEAQRLGLALVPGDRKQQGAVATLSVEKNMLSLVFPSYVRRGVLAHGRLRQAAQARCEVYDVRPRDPGKDMAALSGGNQQKVVLARWLERNPRVLLLHEPTQGVDVATRAEIYEIMRARCRDGVAIIWVSTDFDELATVSDRIVVCAGGRITGEVSSPFSRDKITSEVYATAARGGRREVEVA